MSMPGYYAFEIHDRDDYDLDDPRFCEKVGYHMVKVAKSGRVVRCSSRPIDGIDWGRFRSAIDWERDALGIDSPAERLTDADIHEQLEAQQRYGRLMGKCGCCGRKLTDPESKLRGIGPECWRSAA